MTMLNTAIFAAIRNFPNDENNNSCPICTTTEGNEDWQKHIKNPGHIITLQRFDLMFKIQETKLCCRVCGVVFEWAMLKIHADWHRMLPWHKPDDLYKMFFENHTIEWETKFYCFICDETFTHWFIAFQHIAEETHRRLIKTELPKNKTLQLPSADVSYKLLVNNAVVAGITNVRCRICDCTDFGIQNIVQHIKGFRHNNGKSLLTIDLQKRMGEEIVAAKGAECMEFEKSISKEVSSTNDVKKNVCTKSYDDSNMKKLPKRCDASVEVQYTKKSEKFFKNGYQNGIGDYIQKFDNGEVFCRICYDIFADNDLETHFVDTLHANTLRHFNDNKITAKNDYHFYCGYCECNVSGIRNVTQHINGNKHYLSRSIIDNTSDNQAMTITSNNSLNAKNVQQSHACASVCWTLPCMYFEKYDNGESYCTICDYSMNIESHFINHIAERDHASSRRYFDNNKISWIVDNDYDCEYCECTVPGFHNISVHVQGRRHRSYLSKIQDASSKPEVPTGINKVPVNIELEVSSSDKNPANIEPEASTSNKISVDIEPEASTSNKISVNIVQEASLCNKISVNIEPETSTSSKNPDKGKPEVPTTNNIPAKTEHTTNSLDAVSYILKLHETNYFCIICEINFFDKKSIEDHATGRGHATSFQKYGCGNVTLKEGNNYYCRCCECGIPGIDNVYLHIKGYRHTYSWSAMNGASVSATPVPNSCTIRTVEPEVPTCNKIPIKVKPEVPTTNNVPGKVKPEVPTTNNIPAKVKPEVSIKNSIPGKVKPDVPTTNNIPAKTEHTTNSLDAVSYILKLHETNYFCKICEINFFDKKSIEDHATGRGHATSFQKYGCGNVTLKEGNNYYCRCCECGIPGIDNVYLHIKGYRHTYSWSAMNGASVSATPVPNSCTIRTVEPEVPTCNKIPIKVKPEVPTTNNVPGKVKPEVPTTNNIPAKVKPEVSIKNSIPGKVKPDVPTTNNIPAKTEHTTNSLDAVSYILKLHETNYFCKICEINFFDKKSIEDHATGRGHATSFQKYGCGNVTLKEGNNYYCRCCECGIPGIDNVYLHIKGYRHTYSWSAMNGASVSATPVPNSCSTRIVEPEVPTCNEIPVKVKPEVPTTNDIPAKVKSEVSIKNSIPGKVKPDVPTTNNIPDKLEPTEQAANSSNTFSYILNLSEGSSFCKICDINLYGQTAIEAHASTYHHTTSFHRYGCDNVSLRKGTYYCRCCECGISDLDNVYLHVKGNKHMNSLTVSNKAQSTKPTISDSIISSLSNGLKNSTTTSKPLVPQEGRRLFGSKQLFGDLQENARGPKVRNNTVSNSVTLHTHLVRQFSIDFTRSGEPPKANDVKNKNSSSQTMLISNGQSVNTGLAMDGEKTFVKRENKKMNMKKVLKLLDFDKDHIYDMSDKLKDLELGMKLCIAIDSTGIYCLVCQIIIENTMQNYFAHLYSLEHCAYLDKIERDHGLFADFSDQLSALDLAHEYLEEISDDTVRCLVCDRNFNNNDDMLREHINGNKHKKNSKEMQENSRKNFELVKPSIRCDWYKVQIYWCVLCFTAFRSEVNFVKHLEGDDHAFVMKSRGNAKRKLMLEFCETCALLWYGWRCTYAYHCDIPTHQWLARDGHYATDELPDSVKIHLTCLDEYMENKMKSYDEASAREGEKVKTLIRDIEKTIKSRFPDGKAYIFGSRVSGLGSPDSDVDVSLDCRNSYNGTASSTEEILTFMTDVHECLSNEPKSWDVNEMLTTSRRPIIKVNHRVTGLSCDISFENWLAVENTKLIKSFNDVYPPCRKMILFLKQWLTLADLSGYRGITSYALSWYVIFYLQKEAILPSVARLLAMKNKSHIIAGWQVGVEHNFTYNRAESNFTLKELITRFFKFYANFDFRYEVACPLIGDAVKKREFAYPENLTKEMSTYSAYIENAGSPEPFSIDSPMCIQDPFDLQHNLTKAMSKVYLNRFRTYCSKSLDILCRSET